MKRLLIVSETWYPDSRATISIMARIAEGIAQKGVEVYAVPLKPLANGDYPAEVNGIKIIPVENVQSMWADGFELKRLKLQYGFIRKLLSAEKHLFVKAPVSRWNDSIKSLRSFQRTHWYNPSSDRIRDITVGRQIAALIEELQIDSVISVSLPFWIHHTVAEAKKICENQKIAWVPVCFDPYAYDQSIGEKEQRKRIKIEHRTYKQAKTILMLSQSKADYQADSLLSKLDFFEIPNIRELNAVHPLRNVQLDPNRINCVFIGNLYWTVRNPECLFRLFGQFSDNRIHLHVIGSLSDDFPDGYMELWQDQLGSRFSYYGRVSTEDAESVINFADVLINIGNTTSNQCPSKVLEYISSGKPILSISKIEKCTSEMYLNRYPLSHLIREADCSSREAVRQAEEFILQNHAHCVEFEKVKGLFSDCTNENVVSLVLNVFL